MRAIVIERTGAPAELVLRDVADPVPEEGQHVVSVGAAGINFADTLIRRGTYPQPPPLPFTPGNEVAGETSDGRRVLGLVRRSGGGYAELVAVDDDWLFDLPAGATFEEGAAFALAFLTAWLPLTLQAPVRPGSRVLVHAAAGGVGSAAVQVARVLGGEVVAAVGSPEKRDLPLRLGAAECVTYDQLEGVGQVDVVVDTVGGELFEAALRLLRPLGTLVGIGFAGGPWPTLDPALLVGRNVSVAGFYLGRLMQRRPDLVRTALGDLLRLWERELVQPVVGASFPLADAPAAHLLIEERRSVGKVVLVP